MDTLRRKWSFRIGGRTLVLVKHATESTEHVLMKALLAALYEPRFPELKVEVRYEGEARYKPDLLALDEGDRPVLWGECGEVRLEKLKTLARRYPATHLAFAKWDLRMPVVADLIERALKGARRQAPVDLVIFPPDAARFLRDDGSVAIGWDDVTWRRWE